MVQRSSSLATTLNRTTPSSRYKPPRFRTLETLSKCVKNSALVRTYSEPSRTYARSNLWEPSAKRTMSPRKSVRSARSSRSSARELDHLGARIESEVSVTALMPFVQIGTGSRAQLKDAPYLNL